MNARSIASWILLLMLAETKCAYAQFQLGDPPAQAVQPLAAPVISYAVVDVSGSGTATFYSHVAFDDNFSLGFSDCGADSVTAFDGYFYSYCWQGDSLGSFQSADRYIMLGTYPESQSHMVNQTVSGVTPNGTMLGKAIEYLDSGSNPPESMYLPAIVCTFQSVGGIATYTPVPSLPRPWPGQSGPGPSYPNIDIDEIAANGNFGGSGKAPRPDYSYDFFSYVCAAGHYTVFDAGSDPVWSGASNVTVVSDPLASGCQNIITVNSAGQTVATQNAGPYTAIYWDGQHLRSVGQGFPVGLNEQGSVIVVGQQLDYYGNFAEGYLWENGTTTYLRDTLPALLQGQIQQVEPISISNQLTPGTDATIQILAGVMDNGTLKYAVFTRDNVGVWSFAEMQLPVDVIPTFSRAYYTSINSSGAIACIGIVDETYTAHVMMLTPVYVTIDSNDNHQVDLTDVPPDNSNFATNANPQISSKDTTVSYLRFGLWDNAFDASSNVRNGSAETENFVGSDGGRFYFSVRMKTVAATAATMTVHWYTDSDKPITDTITLTKSTSDPTLYSSKALMLVSDDVDNNQETNTGLGTGVKAKLGEADHRLRKAALGDKVYFEYNPSATGTAKAKFAYEIFDLSDTALSDKVEKLNVQIVNTAYIGGATSAERMAYIAKIIPLIKQRFAVAGVDVRISYIPDDIVRVPYGTINLNAVAPSDSLGLSADEKAIASLVRDKYPNVSSTGKTLFLIIVSSFQVSPDGSQDRGESFPSGQIAAHPFLKDGANCCFVGPINKRRSNFTPAHEIGHMLLNWAATDVGQQTDPLTRIVGAGHYIGPDELYNLMQPSGNGPDSATVQDSKRLWNDPHHNDGVHAYQINYLRDCPLLK